MKIRWFRRWGWFFLPVAWQGWATAGLMLVFCLQVFLAVDRNSHSASDTLYGVFPFFACSFLLFDWLARRTSRESD